MTESRVAVVTGGAAGIGRGIASYFAARGWMVVIADRDRDRAAGVALDLRQAGMSAIDLPTDVRSEAQVDALFAALENDFGRVDCLCNNAGVEIYRPAQECSTGEWNRMHEINLRGPFLCSRSAFPLLKRVQGSIVNISSVQAFANESNISAYAATKAGLLGLTRSTALDFAGHGVRVNAVCPGATQTEMMEAFLAAQDDPADTLARLSTAIPLGCLAQTSDVAKAVYFLASPDASYITGTSLVVDGGLLARLAL